MLHRDRGGDLIIHYSTHLHNKILKPSPASKMVTTFNDRIINLTKTVAPLVGKPSTLLRDPPINRNTSTTSTAGKKRQAPSTFYRPPSKFKASGNAIATAGAKRRCLREELNYTAATIRQALENAGRPPVSLFKCRVRALPSSVNTDSCMTISSAEYDAFDAAGSAGVNDGQSSLDEMLSYASLIQSTRSYYTLDDSASIITPQESIINGQEDDRRDNADDDEDDELRASSDTTSTWAPSSNCNEVNLNDKKTIDNDNRSDGISSNPASSTSGGEETSDISLSDQCEGDEASSSPPDQEKSSLLENENNGGESLGFDNNQNNDEAEDDGLQSKGFFVVG